MYRDVENFDYVTFEVKYEIEAEDAEGKFTDWDYEPITITGNEVYDYFDADYWEDYEDTWLSLIEETEEYKALKAKRIISIDVMHFGYI